MIGVSLSKSSAAKFYVRMATLKAISLVTSILSFRGAHLWVKLKEILTSSHIDAVKVKYLRFADDHDPVRLKLKLGSRQ